MVVDLQHEVHYLNNQLHPLLDEEEEDPKMLVEDNSCVGDLIPGYPSRWN